MKILFVFAVLLILLSLQFVRGQECESGYTRPCGSDTGVCKTGLRTCIEGKWSECIGEKKPTSNIDICDNGLDDNCNGQVDEECANVNETCYNNKHDLGEEGTDCGGKCPRKCFNFPWVALVFVGIAIFFLGMGLYYMQRTKGKRIIMTESLGKD